MSDEVEPFRYIRVADLAASPPGESWLIRSLWTRSAAGVLGGSPKLGKTWIALDMAVSVASKTACLGRFEVDDPGFVLVYFAEDTQQAIRSRIEGICRHRGLTLDQVDLFVVDVPTLRLDVAVDLDRLEETIFLVRPRLLVLDSLVRMHALDENSAHDISGMLAHLTRLQRTYDCAVVLVHHTSKRGAGRPGEALRGSTDLHAWGASNAYLTRRQDHTLLSIEHRAARPPDPMMLELVSDADGGATHFEIIGASAPSEPAKALRDRILEALRGAAPLRRGDLRSRLGVNNERLGKALDDLEAEGQIIRTADGWRVA